jgi:hypothetical protein
MYGASGHGGAVLLEVEDRAVSGPYEDLPKSVFGKVAIFGSVDVTGIIYGKTGIPPRSS